MKNIAFCAVSCFALSASLANAADMRPARTSTVYTAPAPKKPLPFSGVSIGVTGGYGFKGSHYRTIAATSDPSKDGSGYLVGGRLGLDIGSPVGILIGLGLDASYTGISEDLKYGAYVPTTDPTKGYSCNGAVVSPTNPCYFYQAFTRTMSMPAELAFRARLGFEFNRDFLVYATGGAVYSSIRSQISAQPAPIFPTIGSDANGKDLSAALYGFAINTQDETMWSLGWTAGGGLEYLVANSFSIFAEYRFSRIDVSLPAVTASNASTPSSTREIVKPDFDMFTYHSIRGGLNYYLSL